MGWRRAVNRIVAAAGMLVVSCNKSTAPRSTAPVASVTLSPAAATVPVGQTVQLTATPRDSAENPLSGRMVTWASSDSSAATVNGSGLVTAVAVGGATITATCEGKSAGATITVTAPTGGTPDPTLLPVATTSQAPLTTAYDALNVPGLAAGGSYLDPTTGVKVYKITSATLPAASANWGHDYAEGGDEVSLPYRGATRAVLVHGSAYWLIDFTPGVGVGNGRQLTSTFAPVQDQAFAFSTNPATPWYAYVSNGTSVRRLDIRTMTEAVGDGWPVTNEPVAVWLQQSENDGLFTWMRGASGPTVVGYEPATGTLKTYTNTGIDEPRIDRAGRYIGLTMATPAEALYLWDWQADSIVLRTTGDPGIPFIHVASLRDRWYGVDWNLSQPYQYVVFDPVARTQRLIGGPTNSGDEYGNGNWIQHPADLDDQWALFSHFEGLEPGGGGWLAPGGMVYVTANGQRRLLGHPYTTITEAANYALASFVRQSSDGRYVMFTSDMNGSGRTDVFLVEVPTR